MAFSTDLAIIDMAETERRYKVGRFFSKGYLVPITFDVENPWVFTGIMVRGGGDVIVKGTDGNTFLMPDLLPGIQYWAPGKMIVSTGTTAPSVFVYGGV